MALASPQIAGLRQWLARTEVHGHAAASVLPFEVAEVDAHVPGGGLALGLFHEVIEGGAASEYAGLAIVRCGNRSALHGAGPLVFARP